MSVTKKDFGHLLPFACEPGVVRVLRRLLEAGPARLVGGYVRDLLLKSPSKDIDVATPLLPAQTLKLLEPFGGKGQGRSFRHGTVCVYCGSWQIQVTTLREDIITHGRHATVSFSHDWEKDAQRRDFTINALYLSYNHQMVGEEIVDFFEGQEDLRKGIIRFIGDPFERIREDYLRILRFFRFSAYYGRGQLQEEGLRACAKAKEGLNTLSRERVTAEFQRLLMAPYSTEILTVMKATSLLSHIAPIEDLSLFSAVKETFDKNWILYLCALFSSEGRGLHCLALSDKQQKLLERMGKAYEFIISLGGVLTPGGLHKGVDLFGKEALRGGLCLWAAGREGAIGYLEAFDRDEAFLKSCPVQAGDLMEKGLKGGALGEALEVVKRRWEATDCQATKESLLHFLGKAGYF